MGSQPDTVAGTGRLIAYVGCYRADDGSGGGVQAFEVAPDGAKLTPSSRVERPEQAGYLAYAAGLGRLYVVDERKTDGRGPVGPGAALHAFAVDPADGGLTWLNSRPAPGPFPTFVTVDEAAGVAVTANHGSFDHVERMIRTADGGWDVEFVYDDSTLVLYDLQPDGTLGPITDVQVLAGHGPDPNSSPQAGGHAQASPHAHSAVIDPSGRYLLVGDKGTDQILVFALETTPRNRLVPVHAYRMPAQTAPRHLAFDTAGRVLVTCELSSELACLGFDAATGELELLATASTVAAEHTGLNEPAEVRVHPGGRFVYVNNRGEDSLAWFRIGAAGDLTRLGHVPLHPSIHPGVAARSFTFDPTGAFVLVADRPANLVRSFAVDPVNGDLSPLTEIGVGAPAFIVFANLPV